jgi:prepilin-type N-terminal cleavage/methylation domain-containing protein
MYKNINLKNQSKGFTLIELLIVIAILAILATVVLLVINPVQMFAQARDSQRLYDLNTLSNATALYLTTVTSPSLMAAGTCGTNFWATLASATNRFVVAGAQITNYGTEIDGTGWVPVAFSAISGGSPLSKLPIDPINDATYFYSYSCNNTSKWFEFDAKMESVRYSKDGPDDVESTDGGNQTAIYEVGNDPGLDL